MRPARSNDPLRAFLWGKRAAIRHPLALALEVHGAQHPVRAISMDVSAGGLLLRVPVADLQPDDMTDVDPFVLAETHFRGPCVARFKRHRLKVHLELVRLDYRPDEREHLYVGFRFSRPLMEKQLKKLGLDPSSCGAEAHGLPSDLVELRAAGDPVVGRLVASGVDQVLEGGILGLNKRGLCLRLDEADIAAVASTLHGRELRIDVLEGDEVQWTSHARLQTLGLLDDAPNAVELGLVLETAPSRALRKHFRPHWAA